MRPSKLTRFVPWFAATRNVLGMRTVRLQRLPRGALAGGRQREPIRRPLLTWANAIVTRASRLSANEIVVPLREVAPSLGSAVPIVNAARVSFSAVSLRGTAPAAGAARVTVAGGEGGDTLPAASAARTV